MEASEENAKVNKDNKTLTARILSTADISAMMTGTQKGLPIKVPTIPIKVLTPNATQPSTIPGVIVAKSPTNPTSAASPILRPSNSAATNLILKATKGIPLVLEKAKSPDLVVTTTSNSTTTSTSSKVPNILRGTNSPSKNTIDRQVVSHEATIELRKVMNKTPILNGSSSAAAKKAEKIDLLKPLSDVNDNDSIVDLSEINLKCEENELGAIEVKSLKIEEEEESSDQSLMDGLICKETLQTSPPNQNGIGGKKAENLAVKKDEPKVRDDDILCCGGCGCYGMAGEFFSSEACCSSCHSRILQKNREKEKKERELAIQKQRREQRKKEQREAKEKQKQIKVEEESNGDEDDDEDENDEMQVENLPFDSPHPWLDASRGFSWSRYLECTNSRSAPSKLFHEAFPPGANHFRIGQKLEAIDPEHPALICVASIAQIQGHRLLIHFDGFSKAYDFWENANSPNLFPVGWCESHRQKLMPPPGYEMFTWRSYLESTNSQAAPKENFLHFNKPPKPSELNGWKIGLKLEAVDRSNTSLVCVATVTNVMDGRVLIHFDGWDLEYDYWVTPSSPYIHPKGWCVDRGIELNKPKGYRGDFSWERYLEETRSKAVPNWAFKTPKSEVTGFKKGMKLEVVDQWNPIFVRVATIVEVDFHQVRIHFDGWPHNSYDFWCPDDSSDLHPVSWCAKTNHQLMPPLTVEEVSYYMAKNVCPTPGCRGLGNVNGYEISSHDGLADCPYAPQNLNNDSMKPDRLRSMRRQSRSISTDSDSSRVMIKTEPCEDDPELGRGNRKRKKRKFFDDENDPSDLKRSFRALENDIRKDVFSSELSLPQQMQLQQNTDFLKPITQSLTPSNVRQWSAKDVANFVMSIPRLNCDLPALESKIIEEEIDGEAFLLMTQSDFVTVMSIKFGPAIKIYNALMLIVKNAVAAAK